MFIRVEVAGYDNSLPLDVVEKEIKEYFSVNRSFAHHHKTSSAATEMFAFLLPSFCDNIYF